MPNPSPLTSAADPGDVSRIAEFIGSQDWPFHGGRTPEQVAASCFAPDVRTFWVLPDGAAEVPAGLVRLFDLADGTPMFDLRIAAAYRGAGLGTQTLRW